MNSLHLIGRLTKDPEVQYGADNGTAYCSFVLAVDRGKAKSADGETADFPRLVAFGKTAENMGKYLEKGKQICVDGSVRTSSYEKDGEKHYKTELIANKIQFLEWKENDEKA